MLENKGKITKVVCKAVLEGRAEKFITKSGKKLKCNTMKIIKHSSGMTISFCRDDVSLINYEVPLLENNDDTIVIRKIKVRLGITLKSC